MGFQVTDPFGGDEALAGAGAGAGFEEGGVDADVSGVGEVDEGNQGCCVCGVEDGEERIGGVVCFVDRETGVTAKPLILRLQYGSISLWCGDGSATAWL